MKLTTLAKQLESKAQEKKDAGCGIKQKLDQAQDLLEKTGALEYLGYCYDRWQDEKEYEDWQDYATALMKKFKQVNPTKITKSPFCVWFMLDETTEAGFKVIDGGKSIQGFATIKN
jgi:predicted N-acyltransferase